MSEPSEIRACVEKLSNASMGLSLVEWGFISNVFLEAASIIEELRALRAEDAVFAREATAQIKNLQDENSRLGAVSLRAIGEKQALRGLLSDLYAMIEGECPSLLEDHHLAVKIYEALEATRT